MDADRSIIFLEKSSSGSLDKDEQIELYNEMILYKNIALKLEKELHKKIKVLEDIGYYGG